MKKCICKFGILPLLLIAPSLMAATQAATKEDINSCIYDYRDFDITVKTIDKKIYEFTINNYGDGYIVNSYFEYQNQSYYCPPPESGIQKGRITYIKPKDTATIKVVDEYGHQDPLEDMTYTGFGVMAYMPKNDILSVSKPAKIYYKKHDNYCTLNLDCHKEVLKNSKPKSEGLSYLYSYAVSWSYEGKEYCSITSETNKVTELISISLPENSTIDTEKVTINNIDSLIQTRYYDTFSCGGVVTGGTVAASILMPIGIVCMSIGILIGLFAIIFYTCRAIGKKIAK